MPTQKILFLVATISKVYSSNNRKHQQ